MTLIYYTLTLALILLHFTAISAVVSHWVASAHVARATGVLVFTLVCFFLEHFQGWGSLFVFWPLTTAVALLALWNNRERLKRPNFWHSEIVFLVFVGYGLMWKWFYPSIYPTSERVTDLYFIGNYLAGATLPPPDHWFASRVFDFYYAFQHYGAALMARLFSLKAGLAYNLAMPLLMGMCAALVWDLASRFVSSRVLRTLLVLTLMVGGTGVSPVMQVIERGVTTHPNEHMVASARFIGLSDQQLRTPLAQQLYPRETRFEARELPLENLGYQYFVGDYHPPLAGFFLLLLALALMGMVETGQGHRRINTALIGFTVPVMIAANTWAFPLQALLVGGWAVWRYRGRQKDAEHSTDWAALIGGGVAALLLLYPFLIGFAGRALSTPLRVVTAIDHTPWFHYLTLQWPLLLLLVIGLVVGGLQWRKRSLTLYLALAFAALLLLSEIVFVDDPSGGRFERTNTVMKWWGWIWTGGMAGLGALLLGHAQRRVKWLVAAVMVLITVSYGWATLRFLSEAGPNERGRLQGDVVYTQDSNARDLLSMLARLPEGIVLENIYGDAYTDSNIYAAFTAKPSVMGWPSHLITWHGNTPEVWATRDVIRNVYAGAHPDPLRWLLSKDVRYVVWNTRDAQNAQAWQQLQQALAPDYDWHPVSAADQPPVGLWIRREKN